jgi:Tfp pilus assembly protein PilO
MTLLRRILDEKRRLVYPLVAALVLNGALFVAIVYPLSLKVANGERDAAAAASARTAARTDEEAARATVTGKASADKELKKFYSAVLPPDQSAARRLLTSNIEKFTASANVRQVQQTFEATEERGSDLSKLTTTLVLVGEYRNIRKFIHELETAPEFLVLENVALSQGQEREQGLNVVMKVATYYRAEGNGN